MSQRLAEIEARYKNHDVLTGPCHCGAWHQKTDHIAVDALGDIAWLIAELERERTRFAALSEAARIGLTELDALWDVLYGQNLGVTNWHRNGDVEKMDRFFEDNDHDAQETLRKALRIEKHEPAPSNQ